MPVLSNFCSKFEDKSAVVGVIGLGYVGLPLALGYCAKHIKVIGFDVDSKKIDSLYAKQSYLEHIPSSALHEAIDGAYLQATNDFSRIDECDAIILCVPTPLDKYLQPDLSYITGTMDSVLPYLREGQLLSLESTTWPGTTEEVLRPMIEAKGLQIGSNFYLCFSPEREDPGNPKYSSVNIPKVLGGSTPNCLVAAKQAYAAAFESLVEVSSTRVAEFTKLLENIHRAINIGLVNELKIAADAMGIDIWEVINAAATKPFGFTPFYPGPGLGGHCIPIDPFYLTWKAREFGVHTRFIELAGQINRGMPEFVVNKTLLALNGRQKCLNGAKVLIMGLAYKPNVNDMRESPSFELLERFKALGAEVAYFDPHVPVITPTREHAEWTGTCSLAWQQELISSYDVAVISTNHKCFDLQQLADWCPLVVDTRNAMQGITSDNCTVIKA